MMMMSEKIEKCPICGEVMFKNEDGKLQCPNLIYHLKDPRTKKFMQGKWSGQPNINIDIKWQNKPISENPPTCDACHKQVSGKEIEIAIVNHHISYAAYAVNRQGEYNQKLAKLYQKIRERKINAEEALKREEDLRREYFDKPSQESPLAQTSGHVPIKCPNCNRKLGTVDVIVSANPSVRPEQPSWREYATLPKTAEQERLITEYFEIPKGMEFEAWLDGKDIAPFMEKLEAMIEDLKTVPYIRGDPQRQLSDLNALIYRLLDTLKKEIQYRPDKIYELLKNPPAPKISPTAKMLEMEDRRRRR